MAIWQWNFWILPRGEVLKRFESLPLHFDVDWFETINWWESLEFNTFATFFDQILPRYGTPWAENTQSWGSDNGNRIELRADHGQVFEVVIRADLSRFDISFIEELVRFARENDLLFFTAETGKFIVPDTRDLLSEIDRSRAAKFVNNPRQFFADTRYLDGIDKINRTKYEE